MMTPLNICCKGLLTLSYKYQQKQQLKRSLPSINDNQSPPWSSKVENRNNHDDFIFQLKPSPKWERYLNKCEIGIGLEATINKTTFS